MRVAAPPLANSVAASVIGPQSVYGALTSQLWRKPCPLLHHNVNHQPSPLNGCPSTCLGMPVHANSRGPSPIITSAHPAVPQATNQQSAAMPPMARVGREYPQRRPLHHQPSQPRCPHPPDSWYSRTAFYRVGFLVSRSTQCILIHSVWL